MFSEQTTFSRPHWIDTAYVLHWSFPGGSAMRIAQRMAQSGSENPLAMQEMQVQTLDQEDPLEEEMATHSSILAWRIPWTEKPRGLQSTGLQRVGHNWSDLAQHISYIKFSYILQNICRIFSLLYRSVFILTRQLYDIFIYIYIYVLLEYNCFKMLC